MQKENLFETERFADLLHSKSKGKVFVNFERSFDPSNRREMLDYIEALEPNKDVYLSVGSFKDDRRNSSNIESLHTFICEYDVSQGTHRSQNTPFETVQDALEETRKRFQAKGIPPSLVVNSGGGIHCYWLTEDNLSAISPDEYKVINEALFQVGLRPEFQGKYHNETKDMARVMRIPGTTNRKNSKNPLPCHIIEESGSTYSLNSIRSTVEPFIKIKKTDDKRHTPTNRFNDLDPEFIQFAGDDRLLNPINKKDYRSTSEKEAFLCSYLLKEGWEAHEVKEFFDQVVSRASKYHKTQDDYKEDYLIRTIEKVRPDDHKARVAARKFPFAINKEGVVRIDKDRLLYWFKENIDDFNSDFRVMNKTLRLYNGKFWAVCNDDDIDQQIYRYFSKDGIELDPQYVVKLRKFVRLNRTECEFQTAHRDFREKIAIAFLNGTLYIYPKKEEIEFIEGEWRRDNYNLFYVQEDFSDDLLSDVWQGNIVGKTLSEFYTAEDLEVIQKYLGIVMIPEYNPQQVLVIIGMGANAKGTLASTFKSLFSPGSTSALNVSLWHERFQNAPLMNSIFNVSEEMPKRQISISIFNSIVAQDEMMFDFKGIDPVMAKPVSKHMFNANSLPKIEVDFATMRRFLFAQAKKSVPVDKQSPLFASHFMDNRRSVLAFALQGLMKVIDSGFEKIKNRNIALPTRMLEENDILSVFVIDNLEADRNERLTNKELREALKKWKEDNQTVFKDMNPATLTKRLMSTFGALGWLDVKIDKWRPAPGHPQMRGIIGIKFKKTIAEEDIIAAE